MFERIYNLKNKKKGFTLVELIVVLVILAILLAILVPSMTGWIKKAKEKQILVNARTVYLACQTVGSEAYGDGSINNTQIVGDESTKDTTTFKGKITTLAALNSTVSYDYTCTFDKDTGAVNQFAYWENDDKTHQIVLNDKNELAMS